MFVEHRDSVEAFMVGGGIAPTLNATDYKDPQQVLVRNDKN